MTKQKGLFLASFLLVAGTVLYEWVKMLVTDTTAQWPHYLAVIFLGVVVLLYVKSFAKAVVALGAYLVLAFFDLFWLTADNYFQPYLVGIGPLELWMPSMQPIALGLFIAYGALNFNVLINIYLDYKESRSKPRT
ncbi:MAG: hypothetical protein QM731_20005 [Chitinophagaceae bacterium]